MQHTGEFCRNVTSSGDDDLLREILHFEESVACDSEMRSVNVGHHGLSAGGNQNMRCLVDGAIDFNRVRRKKSGAAHDRFSVGFVQIIGINPVQTCNVFVAGSLDSCPFESVIVDRESIVRCVFQELGNSRSRPHDFFRNTADIDASSAEFLVFDHGASSTVFTGATRRCDTATARADYDHVKFFGHGYLTDPVRFKNSSS